MLAASNIHFGYRGSQILTGAELSLAAGELVCLLGGNGAGKSTLLKIMLGLLTPAKGKVTVDGKLLGDFSRRELARQIAYVPQVHVAPFPYSVRQVVTMGRMPASGMFRAPSTADLARVEEVLRYMEISHLADRPYTQISGGERQLTLIARALAQDAPLLVMDEPLTGLDYGHQVRLLKHLKRLIAEGYGVLMTTHDPDQPLSGCQRVALLQEGRIISVGQPGDVLTPEAILSLYGVSVDLLRDTDGKAIAFRAHEELTT